MRAAGKEEEQQTLEESTRNALQTQASSWLSQAFCLQQRWKELLKIRLNSCPKVLGWLSNCLLNSLPSLSALQLLAGCSVIREKGWRFWGFRWVSKLKPPLLWCCTRTDSLQGCQLQLHLLLLSAQASVAVSLLCCDCPTGCSCSVSGLILGLSSLVLPHALPPRNGAKGRQALKKSPSCRPEMLPREASLLLLGPALPSCSTGRRNTLCWQTNGFCPP